MPDEQPTEDAPDECPECGTTAFDLGHPTVERPFLAWLCIGCRWGTAAY
ncbi:hypothetical protein J7E97_07965 [Streptomyces sp. ISL-66]|nr:hypothetical protein [Streptomyces sp. ISL-66]MBT2467809.1 hypothetical protein [Streptomyces sp. ISL-66]